MDDEEFSENDYLVARAIIRIRELFETAPQLSLSEHPIGGCKLVSYADLKAIQLYAENCFEQSCHQQK